MLSALAQRLEAKELIAALALTVTGATALTPTAATAQTAPAAAVAIDPIVATRAEALIGVLAGKPGYDTLFAPAFKTAVPAERFAALTRQIRTSLGEPRRVASLVPMGRRAAMVTIDYDRGSATMRLVLTPAAPHAVVGLLVTGTTLRDDTAAKVQADLAALPGITHLGVYALDGAAPTPVIDVRGDAPAPLGSAFKLWVLAEAARQVAAGERHWNDVVSIGTPSLPSGILQGWPAGSPVTLQTLATLMISISDNTATDTLLTVLGRAKVDAMAAGYGGNGPVLTTREAFVIKGDPALTAAWAKGDAAQRRTLLTTQAARIAGATVDPLMFSSGPLAIDSVEWFAPPRDMARLLAALRDAGAVVRGILAVNPGIDPATAARFGYVGFKGGSEPGVIALDVLAQAKNGRWYAVSAAWHRPDGTVDEAKLLPLVTRALMLVAD